MIELGLYRVRERRFKVIWTARKERVIERRRRRGDSCITNIRLMKITHHATMPITTASTLLVLIIRLLLLLLLL